MRALAAACMLLLVAAFSCETPPTNANGGTQDTMWIHIAERCSTITNQLTYRFIVPTKAGGHDTTYSDNQPVTAETLSLVRVAEVPAFLFFPTYCVSRNDTVFQGVGAPDTVFIYDTTTVAFNVGETTDVVSTVTADSINKFVNTLAPKFTQPDSIIAQLRNPVEAWRKKVPVGAYHTRDDSANIRLIGAPSWVRLTWWPDSEYQSDHWMYPVCVNGEMQQTTMTYGHDDCLTGPCPWVYRPILILTPDSTHADSSFNWKIALKNKYGLGDTLNISSEVQGLPHACE